MTLAPLEEGGFIPVQYIPMQKKRILYVVHRYAPYPGGSENYVRDMAIETLGRGHEVAVFAGDHKGDLNGVHVTSDPNILFQKWDLIVVHGGDVGVQDYVLGQADKLGGPVLYLLILPSHSPVCVGALHKASYIGCSTIADWKHVESYCATQRSVRVRHGIDLNTSVGMPGFREKNGIKTRYMFLSSGGYWPNKAFGELVEVFNNAKVPDATLVLTGYDNRHGLMPKETEFVKPFFVEHREDMLSALIDADLYLMHSHSEGFGLVLLESMLNLTLWAARRIAGAETMQEYGFTYTHSQQLSDYLREYDFSKTHASLLQAQSYVISSHLISNTVSDILRVLVA